MIREGRVVYVLSTGLTSSGFATVLGGRAKLSDEWVRGIVDADGTVVARSRDANRFVGQKGTLRFLEQYDTTDEGIYRDVWRERHARGINVERRRSRGRCDIARACGMRDGC